MPIWPPRGLCGPWGERWCSGGRPRRGRHNDRASRWARTVFGGWQQPGLVVGVATLAMAQSSAQNVGLFTPATASTSVVAFRTTCPGFHNLIQDAGIAAAVTTLRCSWPLDTPETTAERGMSHSTRHKSQVEEGEDVLSRRIMELRASPAQAILDRQQRCRAHFRGAVR